MKWLPRERRTPFIAVIVATIAITAAIYLFLIRSQYELLTKLGTETGAANQQLKTVSGTIKSADTDTQRLAGLTSRLLAAETDMASGDLMFWTYDTVRRLKQQYKIEITDIGRPNVTDADFLPTFPYKQVKFSISGTAYYHDIGKFIADFENQYPHSRIVGLNMQPQADGQGEKLSFNMQIVVLLKNAT